MASDNEQNNDQDQHSIWNGRFKANPKEGKFFLEIIDKLSAQFDGMPIEEIMQTFWGEGRDVLDKLIKKANKREKKEEAKFAVKGMKRAPTANILFQKYYKQQCDEKKIKFELKGSAEAYKKLSDKEKAKYQKEAERLKVEYQVEYERLRADAIKNGDFPEDKPKRPLSGFLRYLADVREEITEKYKDVADRKSINAQISKDAGEMWNALTDKEKAPYDIAYKKEKEAFDEKLKQWESKETDRRKKQSKTQPNSKSQAETADVEIETAGTKSNTTATAKSSTSKKEAAPKAAPPTEAEADSDVEQPVQKSNTTTTTKPVAKANAKAQAKAPAKTITKATSDTETDAETDNKQSESEPEPEPVVVAVAKSKKTVTKPKTVVESDAENDIPEPQEEVKPVPTKAKAAAKPKAK